MKILIPQTLPYDIGTEDDIAAKKIVLGGIEKFCADIERTVDGAIPVVITKSQRKNRLTKKIITKAILEHEPDMILFNNPWMGNMMMEFGIPLICIMHEPLVRDIRMVELGGILKRLNDSGAHLYFVSPIQLEYHRSMAKRIKNIDFGEIKGFINSSYVSTNNAVSTEFTYDCATVGRNDNEKNPFLIHKKLQKSGLNTLVLTNHAKYVNDAQNEYVEKNSNWVAPQHTIYGLPHDQVMKTLTKSKVFCSTWPKESWGITAMEALGLGMPTILMCKDNVHASENIAADPSHIVKLDINCTNAEFEIAVRKAMETPYEKRVEIMEMTKEKHSRENWKRTILNIIDRRYHDRNNRTLMEFFS
jgi:hypothetical protein